MKKNKNTLVWQINTEGEPEKISYLLGTMHVRDERAFQFESIFFEKILACEVFATEFDLEDAQVAYVEEAMILPNGERLSSLIPNKLYNKINAFLKKQAGLSLIQFDIFKPIAVTNFLTESILSKDRMMSLDETLWHFAKTNDKILRGIETFDEQLEVLKKMSFEDQLKGLKEIASNFSKFRKQLLKMAQLYEKADIAKMYKAAKETAKGGRKLLLYDRNEIMAQRIQELISNNTACVAIGAGHLSGKKGVLRLLKQKGFVVKPC